MAHYEIIRPRRETWRDWLKRSFTLGPYNTKDAQLARLFGGTPVSSGVAVTEQTALNYSAVWAAVNLISGDIGALPLEFYKRVGEGKEKFRNHPLYRVLHDSPNPRMGSSQFRRTMQQNKLVWGNAYAEIIRDGSGTPRELWPLAPWLMEPRYEGNVLYYVYRDPSGRPLEFDPIRVLHLRGPAEDGICGMSAIRAGRDSIGLSIAADRYAGTLFRNGLNVGGAVVYPAGLRADAKVRQENREAIEKMHTGVDNSHRFLTLYEGASFTQFQLKPDDAQMLQSRQFQVTEIARWFGIPPHKISDLEHATYSNIEQQERDYVNALEPHLKEWEDELTLKLIRPLEQGQQIIEFVLEGRLRGDSTSRSDLQYKHHTIGMLTPNEGRSLENRNPIPGGDQAFVSLQNIPLDMVRDYWQAEIESKKQPKQPPPAPPQNNDAEVKALREALDLARALAQKAEDDRDLRVAALEATLDVEKQAHASTGKTLENALTVANDALEQATRVRSELLERVDDLEARRRAALDDLAVTAVALSAAEKALQDSLDLNEFVRNEHDEYALKWLNDKQVLETERDALQAQRDELSAWCDKLKADDEKAAEMLRTAFAERDVLRQERDDKIEAATKLAELATQREQERDAAISERDTALAERDAARELAATYKSQRDLAHGRANEAEVDRDQWKDVAEKEALDHGALRADRQQLQAERDLLRGELDRMAPMLEESRTEWERWKSECQEVMAKLAAETEQRIAAGESLNGETVRAQTLQSERDNAKMKLGEIENALNVATLRIATLEGDIAKLESGATAQREQLATISQREKDAVLQCEAFAADLEAAKTELARARSDIATELDKQRTHKSVLLSAMRSLFVDATERLLYREAERARKNQQTPDKLRAWIDRFYDMHQEHVRATFQPLVGPWTAITGGAPGLLLDRLVEEHITASRRGLHGVLEADGPDEIAANLERTLMRWEKERADAMADALVREGMAQ